LENVGLVLATLAFSSAQNVGLVIYCMSNVYHVLDYWLSNAEESFSPVLILLVDFIANGHTGGEGIKLMEFDMQTNLRTKPW